MNFSLARLLSRRRILFGLGALVMVAIIAFIVEAVLAAVAMSAVKKDGDAIVDALNAGNLPAAKAAARKLASDTSRAQSLTHDPLWWTASKVPWLGKNFAAMQKSATALDAISRDSLPVLLDLADQVQNGTLRPHDGRIAPDAIAKLAPGVRKAADAVDGPTQAVVDINTDALLPGLDSLMGRVQERIGQAKTAIDAAANAFDVLPTMLGGEGERNYLLLVQNPAEIRASGGLPGTWALINATNGRLTMTSTTFLGQLGQATNPIKLTKEEANIFGSNFGTIPTEITGTPDFPRAAEMAAAITKRRGVDVSAVFAVDPVALSYVLRGTGAIMLDHGVELTADNAVPYLMHALYTIDDPVVQNDMFAQAAHSTFDALVAGQGNQVTAIRGLVQGVQRHRVFAWSPDPKLARVIDSEKLTGGFPTDTGSTPQVGLYLNDTVTGKPEYYLQQSSTVTANSCKDGVQTLTMQSSFQSLMPANAAQFPIWVVGPGTYVPKGTIRMNAYLAAPWKGQVTSLKIDGAPIGLGGATLKGRWMTAFSIELKPGQLLTLSATITTGPGQTGDGEFTWTPGMSTAINPATFKSAC